MKLSLRSPLSTAIAILCGLIVLVGYFIDLPFLAELRRDFLQWGIVLAGTAFVIGVLNMTWVHWRQLQQGKGNAAYHLAFFAGLMVTIIIGGWFGVSHTFTRWLYDAILLPIEASLLVVMAISLTYALTKFISARRSVFGGVFLLVVLLALVASVPILGIEIPFIHGQNNLVTFVSRVAGLAGVRGILIGVALGSIATGLRVLIGADRPYGG